MRARLILVATAAVLGVMVCPAPVSAGGSNSIVVVAVVNGTPTGPLELTRTCSDDPGNATSAPFTSSVNPAIAQAAFSTNGSTCTVAVTQADGMTASFGCIVTPPQDAVGMSCGAGNDSVTNNTNRSALATITVTFDPVPPQAPTAVVAAPTTTG